MTPELLVFIVVALVASTGAYWILQFTKVLPLEKKLRTFQARSADCGAFAWEMLHAHRLPATPQSFSDAVQYGVDRYIVHCRGPHLFVWMRRKEVGAFGNVEGELMCRTGILDTLEKRDLELSEEIWQRAGDSPGGMVWEDGLPAAMAGALGSGMKPRIRLLPWGTPDKLWGLVGILEEKSGNLVPGERDGLDILAAYFGSLADRAVQFWELDRAREQLEGGLNVTMARLEKTNLKLIQRAKEMNTLEEITEAISKPLDTEDSLNSIVSIVARSLEADLCAFLLLDETKGELVTQSGAFGLSGDEGSLYRISLKNEAASSVRVFLTGTPFMTGDAQNDPQVIAHFARLWKCHSLIVMPLTVEGRRLGVMRVGSFKRDFFTPDHLKFLRVIAEEAAVLVETAMLSEKLANTNRELAQLHNLKDDFVSTVSHEFKTPLTSVKGFVSVLLEEEAGPLTKEQRRFLKIILSATERLSHLVTGMLDMSRLEGGLQIVMGPVDLEQVARDSVENHRHLSDDRNIRMLLEVPPLLPRAKGNADWLKHVFDNLISNAVKFTPDKGEVTVSLSNKGECLMVTVTDTGIGIPPEDRDRIFEKFFRASNRQAIKAAGTGLGLAICKSIVEKHEGRIWLDPGDNGGGGTQFHFVVPVAKEDESRKPEKKDASKVL